MENLILEGLMNEFWELFGLDDLQNVIEENDHEDYNSSHSHIHGSPQFDNHQPPQIPTDMYQLSTQKFSNRETLLETVRGIAYSQGFVTVIQKSKKNRWVIIGCDRGGSYRTNRSHIPNSGKKKSGIQLMNCPFQICGRMNQDTSWRIEIKDLSHNHDLSSDVSGHPYARRFSREEVNEMIAVGIAPRQILTKFRKGDSNLKAISRTLYNVKAKIIKDGLGGRSMIQALMDELGKGVFIYDVECDNDGHMTHLLFSHPSSIELARIYS